MSDDELARRDGLISFGALLLIGVLLLLVAAEQRAGTAAGVVVGLALTITGVVGLATHIRRRW